MTAPVRSLSRLALAQAVTGLFGAVVLAFMRDFYQGASFAVGAALMLGNMLALAYAWWRVIEQKTIAWTGAVIVIKYAVLLSSIFYLSRAHWFNVTAAGLGIASFLVAALIWALTGEKADDTEDEPG